MPEISAKNIEVIAPNLKRRLSGVTATVVRLVPLQAQTIGIATAGPAMPDDLPRLSLFSLLFMSRKGPKTGRVWHARRITELLAGWVLKHILRKDLRHLFTSASQRHHTGYSKALMRRMDAIVATSSKGASYLDHPVPVIMHGIDTVQFQPAADRTALRQKLGLPDAPIVGCFGRIRAQKGTDVFVDAMIDVLRKRPDAHGILLGRATEKYRGFQNELENKIAAAGLADRLRFLPEVSTTQIADWYAALDLFVAPQRWEGFGLTPLEAMSCAVPVVATTVGAFEELIVDGETGRLIAPGDVQAMVEAVSAYLDADAKRIADGKAARAHVLNGFRIEDEAAALIAMYQKLLAEKQ